MYDKTRLSIMTEVYVNPGIHMREISKRTRLSMPSVKNALASLSFIKGKRSGNRIEFKMDYTDPAIVSAIYAVENYRLGLLPGRIRLAVRSFLEELEEKPILAVLFGSFGRGDYHAGSDIDLLLVFQETHGRKIEEAAKRISLKTGEKISPVYMDYATFKSEFHNPTKTFIKNVRKDRLLLAGAEWWRELINEEA
jgi:predicted nucleotidyltransferase